MLQMNRSFWKGTLMGISLEIQAGDHDELNEESVMGRVRDVITRK